MSDEYVEVTPVAALVDELGEVSVSLGGFATVGHGRRGDLDAGVPFFGFFDIVDVYINGSTNVRNACATPATFLLANTARSFIEKKISLPALVRLVDAHYIC